MQTNPVLATEPLWVTIEDAARYCGRSPATVRGWCRAGRVPVRDGRPRLVALEHALAQVVDRDHRALVERLGATEADDTAPPLVRRHAHQLLAVVEPLLDRLAAAERRAALAEARLAALEAAAGDVSR